MDPITIGLGIAKIAAPRIAKWFFGDDGEDIANQVIDTAKEVTGADDSESALQALQANPELLAQFQGKMMDMEVRLYEEETKRLQAVNQTMQTEYASGDAYVRRWRPTFGYCMAITWTAQIVLTMAAILVSVIFFPKESAAIIVAIGDISTATVPMWAVALSVIGVSVVQRSKDKQVAAGQEASPGIIGTITQRFLGQS